MRRQGGRVCLKQLRDDAGARLSQALHGIARQGRARQGKARQGRTGQGGVRSASVEVAWGLGGVSGFGGVAWLVTPKWVRPASRKPRI